MQRRSCPTPANRCILPVAAPIDTEAPAVRFPRTWDPALTLARKMSRFLSAYPSPSRMTTIIDLRSPCAADKGKISAQRAAPLERQKITKLQLRFASANCLYHCNPRNRMRHITARCAGSARSMFRPRRYHTHLVLHRPLHQHGSERVRGNCNSPLQLYGIMLPPLSQAPLPSPTCIPRGRIVLQLPSSQLRNSVGAHTNQVERRNTRGGNYIFQSRFVPALHGYRRIIMS
jgi:hypothetical protein